MGKYVAQNSRVQKRKQKRARLMAMYSTIAVFILVISFGIVKVIEFFQKDEGEIPLLDNSNIEENTDITQPSEDFLIGPTSEMSDYDIIKPSVSEIKLTENGRVDISYFDDAVFMGDSLADGFNEYKKWMSLKDSPVLYLTKTGTTPRTFLQPGVMIDKGEGPIDVWGTIQQRNPTKIYITLGTNALMAMDPQEFIESYYKLIDKVRENAPNAVIYITTLTPTKASKARSEPRLSLERINESNRLIAKMCNEKGVCLLDIYSLFRTEDGYLKEEIAQDDGYHIKPAGYKMWLDYLITHTKYSPDSPYIPGSPYYLA